jgi:hypothetical protein
MQKPSSGAPVKTPGIRPLEALILQGNDAASRPSGAVSGEGSTATSGAVPVVVTPTVGIHAVALTRRSNISSQEQNKGLSDDPSASQRRAGSWKSTEEEELKRLAGIHSTGPKGTVSWVKVVEAWSTQELPTRTKASLSSKWYDIRSRATLLGSISEGNVLSTTTTITTIEEPVLSITSQMDGQQDPDIISTQVKDPAEVNPMATIQASCPENKNIVQASVW